MQQLLPLREANKEKKKRKGKERKIKTEKQQRGGSSSREYPFQFSSFILHPYTFLSHKKNRKVAEKWQLLQIMQIMFLPNFQPPSSPLTPFLSPKKNSTFLNLSFNLQPAKKDRIREEIRKRRLYLLHLTRLVENKRKISSERMEESRFSSNPYHHDVATFITKSAL